VSMDGVPIGTGAVGPATSRLRALYLEESVKTAI